MNVSNVTNYEKKRVLEFCKNTFSWGDYIDDVWDHWIKEGNFLVIREDDLPVAICHAAIIKKKQVWIEGIRVHEKYRKKGFASKLVAECERIGKQNECNTSLMLVESSNKKSLELAKKLSYVIFETWNLYNLEPKKIKSIPNVQFANYKEKTPSMIFSPNFLYVDSWRWIPLDAPTIKSLIRNSRIIFFKNDDLSNSIAIYSDSKHFDKTLLVTLYSEKNDGLHKILSYIQNFAFTNQYKRIQILTKLNSLQEFENLQYRLKFHLMKKEI